MIADFENKNALIVGGVGFIEAIWLDKFGGSDKVTLLDNLLSSDSVNIPDDNRVRFIYGSVCEPNILKRIEDEYDFIFNLVCFHEPVFAL